MKKMIIAAVALLASTFAVQAQGVHPRLEVAGNFSTNIAKDASGYSVKDYKTRPGFRVAGAVEVRSPWPTLYSSWCCLPAERE